MCVHIHHSYGEGMVRFVDVNNMARWMADTGVESIVRDMTTAMEHDFRRINQFS